MVRLGDDAHGKHSSTIQGLQELDAALRAEMRRVGDDQQTHKTELASSATRQQSNHSKLQDMISGHKAELAREMMTHNENLREMIAQEKAERYRLHNGMQERIDLVENSVAREDEELRRRPPASSVSRFELDEELQRLWQAMDSHTHHVVEEHEEPQIVPRVLLEEKIVPRILLEEGPKPMQRAASALLSVAPPLLGSRSVIVAGTPSARATLPNTSRSISAGSRSMSAGPMPLARLVPSPAAPTTMLSSFPMVPTEPLGAMPMPPVQTEPVATMPMHASFGM